MARRAERDDEISVAELLKETGATARPLTGCSLPPRVPLPDGLSPAEHVDRIEQRAREAAAAQQRAGARIRWVSAICGLVAVVGSLVVIAVTTSSPGREASPPQVPLLPATTPKLLPRARHRRRARHRSRPSWWAGDRAVEFGVGPAAPGVVERGRSPAPCSVRFTVQDQWDDGFTAAVAITNKGAKTLSPWTLSWTFAAWAAGHARLGRRLRPARRTRHGERRRLEHHPRARRDRDHGLQRLDPRRQPGARRVHAQRRGLRRGLITGLIRFASG